MAIHPVAVKNTFGRHLILWCLFIPLLTLIFVPLFVPEQTVSDTEVQMVSSLNIDVNSLTEAANQKFTHLFVDTGMVARTEQFFITPGKAGPQDFAATWMHGVWLMLYKALWRFYVLCRIFFLPFVVLAIAAAVDGFTVRARKKYRFETTNPVFFYSSTHLVVGMLGLFTFLPLAPFTFSALVLVGLLLVLSGGIWLSSANFQTGS